MLVRKGQVVWVDLNGLNSEQQGIRPSIVVQNDIGNKMSPMTIIVPFTTAKTKARIPTHVELSSELFVDRRYKDSVAICEQVRAIDKKRIVSYEDYILPQDIMKKIEEALLISVGYSEDRKYKVAWINLSDGIGSEQSSLNKFPSLIVQNDIGNRFAPTYIIVPLSKVKKKLLPTQTFIAGTYIHNNFKDSIALFEQIRVIDKERVEKIYDNINFPDHIQKDLNKCLLTSFGINK